MCAYRGRFAPSPSGWLHLGNARTALVAWLRARTAGGAFVLRVEDLDPPRTRAAAVAGNLDELRWLGLDWDEGPDVGGPHAPYRQSERGDHYAQALAALRARGSVFECFLSRKDVADAANAPHGAQPVYGPRQRRANADRAPRARAQGARPSLRFRVPAGEVGFADALAGPQRFDAERDIGDVVVQRSDGLWSYQFAVVVDDAAMAITEVVRADDLLPATGAQLLLHRALGHEPPGYLHLPLLLDEAGERMAKRRGSLTLHALREAGVRPERVVGWLAYSLGLTPHPEARRAASLGAAFDVARLARAPRRMTAEDVAWLQDLG